MDESHKHPVEQSQIQECAHMKYKGRQNLTYTAIKLGYVHFWCVGGEVVIRRGKAMFWVVGNVLYPDVCASYVGMSSL